MTQLGLASVQLDRLVQQGYGDVDEAEHELAGGGLVADAQAGGVAATRGADGAADDARGGYGTRAAESEGGGTGGAGAHEQHRG